MEDSCRAEDVLESLIDQRAERLHATYLANNPPRPGDASNPLSPRRPWRELWSYFRDDNRNRADFLEARLRAVGLRIAAAGQGGALVVPDQLDPREREILARLEHRRWVVSRLLAGWSRGPRDDAARRHPSVCPWSELSDTERAKDDVAHDVGHALDGGERLVRG
jgi:AcrR family transcriptional regulator